MLSQAVSSATNTRQLPVPDNPSPGGRAQVSQPVFRCLASVLLEVVMELNKVIIVKPQATMTNLSQKTLIFHQMLSNYLELYLSFCSFGRTD